MIPGTVPCDVPKGHVTAGLSPVSWRSGICERLAQRLLSHGYIFSYPIPMTFKCYLKQAGVSKTAQRSLPRQIALRFDEEGFAPLRCVATPLCKTSTALAALQHRSAQDDTRDGAWREQAPALRVLRCKFQYKKGLSPLFDLLYASFSTTKYAILPAGTVALPSCTQP